MYNRVRALYQSQDTREELRQYFRDTIKADIVKKVLDKEPVEHLATAYEYVDKVFHQMSIDFEANQKKDKPVQNR